MASGPTVRIDDDPDSRCAESIAGRLRTAASRRGIASLAVSGGSSAPAMFERLAALNVPWARVGIWQVDERVAPDGDPDRNAGQLVVLAGTHHPMPVTAKGLPAAAKRYGAKLPERFDVVHLGMGDDGHTASWPPDDPVIDSTAAVALSQPYQGRVRMTLTPSIVNAARSRIVLLHGAGKASALANWVEGARTVPIARLRSENTVVFADASAASQLSAASAR